MIISIFFIHWKAIYIYITVVRSSQIYMYCALYNTDFFQSSFTVINRYKFLYVGCNVLQLWKKIQFQLAIKKQVSLFSTVWFNSVQ